MFDVPLPIFFTVFVTTGVVLIFALWIYYDRMGVRRHDRLNQTVFHCVRCGKLYGVHGEVKQAECPDCNLKNIPLRF
ncbi:hydrogenase nickel incorporation protein HypA [Puniceicoccus vermicola]|uniref:Hydrogenase nickel incorporation protein HypA n=1 Tax=Puniceicoccus vermicola TaxID=388746 RepID=A0A7X1B0H6_9BACT|nr:hydrogenase nickel incorporation protein HypA [Puniceicoccus vermicola]MBC2603302.1 hydrogenase nickel incorporation protein HypA [Puniceicoccus vermicola]